MADRTVKSDDTNDLVLSNNDGSAKIEVNEAQNIILTGGSTTGLTIDTSGNAEFPVSVKTDTISEKTSATGVTIDGTLIKDNSIKPASGQSLVLQEDGGAAALTIDTSGDVYSTAWTSRTWTMSGFSGTPISYAGGYKRIGKMVYIAGNVGGTSNQTYFYITNLPYSPKNVASLYFCINVGSAQNNGTSIGTASVTMINSVGNLRLRNNSNTDGWTNSGNKFANFSGWYEAESI